MKRSLTKKEIIKKKKDFKRCFSAKNSVKCYGSKLFFAENEYLWNRFAITFSRKYGNSVVRNKAKRTGKEIYRNIKFNIKTNYDLLFIFYPGEYSYVDRKNQILYLLNKAGLFNETNSVDK